MLAERTDEHLKLFREDREAAFFSNSRELLDKARYYLAHDKERQAIATAGRDRCISSGYSIQNQLKRLLIDCSAANSYAYRARAQ